MWYYSKSIAPLKVYGVYCIHKINIGEGVYEYDIMLYYASTVCKAYVVVSALEDIHISKVIGLITAL